MVDLACDLILIIFSILGAIFGGLNEIHSFLYLMGVGPRVDTCINVSATSSSDTSTLSLFDFFFFIDYFWLGFPSILTIGGEGV